MAEETMVVINCGTQGMHKFRYVEGTRTLSEHKVFPPNVAVTCSREMGEALLKKHSNPNMAIFFRNPNDPKQRAEIQNRLIPNFGPLAKSFGQAAEYQEEQPAVTKRKYTRRK